MAAETTYEQDDNIESQNVTSSGIDFRNVPHTFKLIGVHSHLVGRQENLLRPSQLLRRPPIHLVNCGSVIKLIIRSGGTFARMAAARLSSI
jgi:hypothetical protein